MDRAWPSLLKAVRFALEADLCGPTASALIEALAPYMERRGHWGEWQQTLEKALTLAENKDDRQARASLSALLGRLSRRQSQFRQSVACYRRAIRLSRQVGDLYNEGRACTNLGYAFIEHGQWHRAEILCCHALQLFERLDNAHGQAHTHNHLGILHTKHGAWPKAQHHLQVACAIWASMGDEAGLMQGWINLGYLYNDMTFTGVTPLEDALTYFAKAMDYARLCGDEFSIGLIYMNQGIAYRLKQDAHQAECVHRKAEVIFNQQSNLLCLAQVWDNLGLVYIDQAEWQQADHYLHKALNTWQNLHNHFGATRTMLYLAIYADACGDKSRTLSWLKVAESRLYHQPQTRQYRILQDQLDSLYSRVMPAT